MICQMCNEHEAIATLKVVSGNGSVTKYVCQECMLKYNQAFRSGNMQDLLSNILAAFSPVAEQSSQSHDENVPEIVCENCGMTYRQFKKEGRLGCPSCYTAFRSELEPMLKQIHGRAYHVGRQLLTNERAQMVRSRQEELTRQMNQAVAVEDFETAAMLRDQLKALMQKEENPSCL